MNPEEISQVPKRKTPGQVEQKQKKGKSSDKAYIKGKKTQHSWSEKK